jgi:hypothetical protein
VVLGTDFPAPMFLDDPVNWINGLVSLTDVEKKAILEDNPAGCWGSNPFCADLPRREPRESAQNEICRGQGSHSGNGVG